MGMPWKMLWIKIQPIPSNESCRSFSIWHVVTLVEDFCVLLGNKGVWGGKFSQGHCYSLRLSGLPNIIEVGQDISPAGEAEENYK